MRKIRIISLAFVLSLCFFCQVRPQAQPEARPPEPKPDISCLIVDLKYDGDSIKILEFGNITMSVLSGHGRLYGVGKIWEGLWKHLVGYGMPVWFVASGSNKRIQRERFTDRLGQVGVKLKKHVDPLVHDAFFLNCAESKRVVANPTRIQDYKGIVVVKGGKDRNRLEKLRARFSGFLILNDAVYDHARNKHKTATLFNDDQLAQFKPQWKTYPKQYSEQLVQEIKNDFASDWLVIKPVNSTMGHGIIMLHKDELDCTLKKIFKKHVSLKKMKDKSYSHWFKDANKHFLVESLEHSKPVVVGGKQYDGTMRVVFVLHYSDGQIGLEFLGSYWKFPVKAIDEDGSLIERLKSKIQNSWGVAKVSAKDLAHVQEILSYVLPKVYAKMLQASC